MLEGNRSRGNMTVHQLPLVQQEHHKAKQRQARVRKTVADANRYLLFNIRFGDIYLVNSAFSVKCIM